MEIERIEVCHFIRKMTGTSNAVLVGASDGNFYVAKFAECGKRPNALFNESVGYEVYLLIGLPVPEWRCLSFSSWMLHGNADCFASGSVSSLPNSRICFGSRFLAALPFSRAYDLLPYGMFHRVSNREDFWLSWLVDALTRRADYRRAVFVEGAEGQLTAVFIDQEQMFGGSDGLQPPSNAASQYFDSRIYTSPTEELETHILGRLSRLDGDAVLKRLADLPDEWKSAAALQALSSSLERLCDSSTARSVCEELFALAQISAMSARCSIPVWADTAELKVH